MSKIPFKTRIPTYKIPYILSDPSIGEIEVIYYGSTTVNEVLEWNRYHVGEATENMPLTLSKIKAASLILSRSGETVTVEDLLSEPDFGVIELLYQFFLKEQSRWVESEKPPEVLAAIAEAEKKSLSPDKKKS